MEVLLTSKFNSDRIFTDVINYTYIPNGNVNKTVHFILDGKEIGTSQVLSSGEQQTFELYNLTHGDHVLESYFECDINGQTIRSNKLIHSIIYAVPGNTTPIIASIFDANKLQEQYVSFKVPYKVYTPGYQTSKVELYVNNELVSSLPEVDQSTQN